MSVSQVSIRKLYVVLAVVGVVLILLAVFFAQVVTWYSSQVVAKDAGDPIGIAPFTDRIDFGDIPRGAEVTKTLTLENEGSVDNWVKVFVLGGIGDLVEITPRSSFTLKEGESMDLDFRMAMPHSMEPETKVLGTVVILRFPKGFW